MPLRGDEPFAGVDATVMDFWRYAMSDLRMNNVRGYLAEFIVSRAVGATASQRVEWDDFDVLAPDGTRIEVKSSGFLQSWEQAKPSVIRFGGLRGRGWNNQTGRAKVATYHADVYVFCLQTAVEADLYDALDVGQWDFYVVSARRLEARGVGQLSLRGVTRLAGEPVTYDQLAEAVASVSAV